MRHADWATNVLLGLVAAIGVWLHLAPLRSEFDRGFDGFQGAFFAAAAVNYERLGSEATFGYPLVQIDPGDDRAQWYVYPNHPRAVPRLAHAALDAFAPAGWEDRTRPLPPGTEAALRAPFFAAQLLGLALLALALWFAAGVRAALIGLAIGVHLPISYAFVGLVNYELPALVFVTAGLALAVRARGERARVFAIAAGAACGLGTAVTYAPVLFVPAVAYACRRGRPAALVAGFVAAFLALLPHVFASTALRERGIGSSTETLAERVRTLGPFADQAQPVGAWLAAQSAATLWSFGGALTAVALLGAACAARDLVRARRGAGSAAPLDLARSVVALCACSVLVQVVYWRHTGDPQEIFWLNSVPTVVLACVYALDVLRRTALATWPRAVAELLPFALIALCSASGLEHQRDLRAPGPLDLEGARGPAAPLPRTVGAEIAALVPTGTVVWYPASLGLTPAASFYAWRTLLPVQPGGSADTMGMQREFGLGDRPVWLVLPLDPTPQQDADVTALARELEDLLGGEPEWVEGRFLRAAKVGR